MRPRSLLRVSAKCGPGDLCTPAHGAGRSPRELVSGASIAGGASAVSTATGGDVLDAVAGRLGIPQVNLGKGYIGSLRTQNQATENRCVATSVATGIYLRALSLSPPKVLEAIRPASKAPSVCHLYHAQRRRECLETRRCNCGDVCGGLCNAECGSLLSVVVGVCREGVALESAWPVSKARDTGKVKEANDEEYLKRKAHYRLTRVEFLNLGLKAETVAYNVERMIKEGIPVVCNMYLYPNQEVWNKTQRKVKRGKTVYDEVHTMPQGKGVALPLGHCVLIVGFREGKVRIRNSFGEDWGWHGDFSLPYALLRKDHIHGLMGIEGVVVENTPFLW